MSRVALRALGSCSLVLLLVGCTGNGGTGDAGGGNVLPCDGGEITLDVTAPECLWAPDHKMVLFSLDDIHATATGGCSMPTITVVGVTDNQPASGGGQGSTIPDYTYNSTGVCLRSEREGTSSTPRIYTVTLQATDGVTTVQESVEVTVAHGQNGARCDLVDSSRIVDDGDSRCN